VSQDPRWSPDRIWWWDGTRWIPASQAPVPPPPPLVPPSYENVPPATTWVAPPPVELKPSPGLRTFLIVVLGVDIAATGFMSVFGLLAVVGGAAGGADEPSGAVLLGIFVVLLALAVAGLIGVIVRAVWARWVALAAGIAVCLTCLGAVIGIPIIVAASRAPLGKPA